MDRHVFNASFLTSGRCVCTLSGMAKTTERNWAIPSLLAQGLTLTEVGARFGISRQRVEQIVKPTKTYARERVFDAIRAGKLTPPAACANCAQLRPVQGHHHDYSLPLEVTWLCTECHGKAHSSNMPKTPHSSFRLSPEARALLEALAAHYGLTLTGALELAIRESARKAKVKK